MSGAYPEGKRALRLDWVAQHATGFELASTATTLGVSLRFAKRIHKSHGRTSQRTG